MNPVTSAEVGEWEGMARTIVRDYWAPGLEEDDLMQEARVGVFKGLRDFQPGRGQLAAFVAMCIRRQVINAVKTATRGKHGPLNDAVRVIRSPEGEESDAVDCVPVVEDPPTVLDRRDDLHRLGMRIRERLTLVECQCLIGVLNGDSYEEIARRHGLGVKSIDNALQRARRKLEAATKPHTQGDRDRGDSCPGCGGPTRKRPGRGRPPKCVVCRVRAERRAAA